MPTAFSRPERSDRSANADSTPRGHRTPRGQRPQHTPRGGRSDFSDRRRTNNDDSNKETRNRSIEDAFNASLDQIRMNNLCFAQCILQVLRKQTGVRNERDHDFALQDWWQWQEKGSKHLSYLFRHTKLTHKDGSLSLNEMLSHGGTARKIRDMHKSGHAMLSQIDVGAVPAPLRGRNNTIRFLMPLAHVICDANKSCAMIGFLSTDNFAPGKFRKRIPGLNQPILAMMKVDNNKPMILMHKTLLAFFRFESGHSNNITIAHTPFRPAAYQLRYLVHGTNEQNLQSIRRSGLIPGGTRGGRNHVHFALDCLLTTMVDALRPESDCILIARPDAVSDLDPVITESQYVLTPHTVPFERFCGVWSLIDRAWLEIPDDGELARMNNYKSDVDSAMHTAHHQFYWEKRNEVEQNNGNWQRSDYVHYVTGQLSDSLIVAPFLNSFRQAKAKTNRPVRDTPTPNDRSRGPPKTSDDERIDRLRAEVRERFRSSMKKSVEKQKKRLTFPLRRRVSPWHGR